MLKSARLIIIPAVVLGIFLLLGASKADATSATDNFNRADGALGANWTDFSGGGLLISSQEAVGTASWPDASGDIRTGESFNTNQYSEIETSTTELSGVQWVGAVVRAKNAGQDAYIGFYWWNNGTPIMMLFKRVGGSYAQLGQTYASGALPGGTKLRVMVVGTTVSFLQDGVERIAAYDGELTGGAPGIMMADVAPMVDNWSGGDASFEYHYLSTDGNGVKSYDMISNYNGYGPHILRVLQPNNPVGGLAHNFLYVLPVEAEGATVYGDGFEVLRALGAQNTYNSTIIAPSFAADPWYADHPTDPNYKYESFMVSELQPWVKANLATSGSEKHLMLGFSKSGFGPVHLILKYPALFDKGAFWDFPANMSAYDAFGAASTTNYGTDSNFQNNYRLTSAFVGAHAAPFTTDERLWISDSVAGAGATFQADVSDFHDLLLSYNIVHTYFLSGVPRAHTWNSGWVPGALAKLYEIILPFIPPPTITSSNPLDNATDVAIDSNIILTFSANMAKGIGNILINKTSDDSTALTIDVRSADVSVAGNTATINPSSDFDYDTGYYITMESSTFSDTTTPIPNAYDGISLKTTLNFTTVAAPDIEVPPAPPSPPSPPPASPTPSSSGKGGSRAVTPTTNNEIGGEDEPPSTVINNTGTNIPEITYDFGLITLRFWSKGTDVMDVQRFLNRFINVGLAEDGILGPKTSAVVRMWQYEHGLSADGAVGPLTKAAMYASIPRLPSAGEAVSPVVPAPLVKTNSGISIWMIIFGSLVVIAGILFLLRKVI